MIYHENLMNTFSSYSRNIHNLDKSISNEDEITIVLVITPKGGDNSQLSKLLVDTLVQHVSIRCKFVHQIDLT